MHKEKISNKERNNFVLGNKLEFLIPTEFIDVFIVGLPF